MTSSSKEASKEEETIRGTQSTARLSIWVAVIIIAIAMIGYLTSRSSFTAENVAAGIASMTEDMGAYLAASGHEGQFTYASLSLEGNLFSRRAVVQQPEFVLHNTVTGEELRISTEYLVIKPKSAEVSSFSVYFEKPLELNYGDVAYRVIQELPVSLSVHRVSDKDTKTIEYASEYSEGMSFIVQVDGLTNDQLDTSYQFHVGVGSTMKGVLDLAKLSYYEESDVKNLAVEFGQSILKAEALKFVSESAGHDDSRFRHYKANGEGFSFVGPHQALGKFAVAFEVEEELPSEEAAKSRKLALNNLEITGEDFGIKGQSNMMLLPEEILPYGEAGFAVTSVDKLLGRLSDAQVIPHGSAPLVSGLVQRAATPTEDSRVVQINLQRSPGGAFVIGNSTFEELTVSVLRDLAQGVLSSAPASGATPPVAVTPQVPGVAAGSKGQETAPDAAVTVPEETPVTEEAPKEELPNALLSAPIKSDADALRKLEEISRLIKERQASLKAAQEAEENEEGADAAPASEDEAVTPESPVDAEAPAASEAESDAAPVTAPESSGTVQPEASGGKE